jgi:hypothetical protein
MLTFLPRSSTLFHALGKPLKSLTVPRSASALFRAPQVIDIPQFRAPVPRPPTTPIRFAPFKKGQALEANLPSDSQSFDDRSGAHRSARQARSA